MSKLKSPVKRHGGKSHMANRIVELMPPHSRYLEAFFGGGSVLFAKPCEGVSEYANDLDGELANFWQVLRDTPDRMLRALWATPLSPESFQEAKQIAYHDNVKRATAFFVRNRMSRQALERDYCTPTTRCRRGMNEQVSAWWGAIEGLPEIHERLKRVEIWKLPAVEAIKKLDHPNFFTYLDPPYLHSTRKSTGEYGACEMSEEDHRELLVTLVRMKGKFMISGYSSKLYDDFAVVNGWRRVEFEMPNSASSSRKKEKKTECLWMNY